MYCALYNIIYIFTQDPFLLRLTDDMYSVAIYKVESNLCFGRV